METTILPRKLYNDTIVTSATFEKGPHVSRVPLQTISVLAPFSALIISIIFVVYFLIRFYILEGFLLKKLYGKIYANMDEVTRRGFVNHHIAGGTKILILVVAAYPFIDVAFGNSTFHSPFAGSKFVTQGDILIVVAQMLIAMYVFELFYRPKISPVSVGHHIGTIMIGQSAIAISLNLVREKDATIEFILCTVWGKSGQTLFCSTLLAWKAQLTNKLRCLRYCLRVPPSRLDHPLPRLSYRAQIPPKALSNGRPHDLRWNNGRNDTHYVSVWKFMGQMDHRI